MKKWADQQRRPFEFQPRDMVLLKVSKKQLRFRRSHDTRLIRKFTGPFPIIAKIGRALYKIDPPAWIKVHLVFHVSNLRPYHPDPEDPARNHPKRAEIPESTRTKNKNPRQIEEILADRIVTANRKRRREFLVKWKGRAEEETSWEKVEDLGDCEKAIEDFEAVKSSGVAKS